MQQEGPPPSQTDLWTKVLAALKADWRAQLIALWAMLLVLLHIFGVIDVLAFIHRYQALIGTVLTGIFGFYTVNKTLRTNAENAQKLKDREKDQEREAVRVALLAELTALRVELKIRFQSHKDMETLATFVIRSPVGADYSRAYRAILARIGLLPLDQIRAVVKAHAGYEGTLALTKWLHEEQRSPGKYNTKEMNEPYRVYLQNMTVTIEHIESSISRLGGTLDKLPWEGTPQ